MASDELPAALYDFLYKDSSRIASYYAQFFGGRLSSFEESNSERSSHDTTFRGTLAVASGDFRSSSEIQEGAKRVLDPHDTIATDVLAVLREQDYIHQSPADAPHGALVLAHGTLVFVDRGMLELAALGLDFAVAAEAHKPRAKRDVSIVQGAKLLKEFLSKLLLPSAFLLQTNAGIQMAGTIKDSGMEEPIASYYFKHGTAGLADVYLIGIKEIPSVSFTLPNTQLIGAGQQAAQALSDMLFPPEAIRVTPIALFREL